MTRTLANLGHREAQHEIGQKLLHGFGVVQNETEAMRWFRLSSQRGHPESAYNLAVGHLNGVQTDLEVGLNILRMKHGLPSNHITNERKVLLNSRY